MKQSLNLMLGGDVMLARGVGRVINENGVDYPFEEIRRLTKQADCFFVNLECALSSRPLGEFAAQKKFRFKADPEAVGVLTDAGVDLVTLANNHALDAGPDSLFDTLQTLHYNNIRFTGAGGNRQEASKLCRMECNGVELGVLSYCDHEEAFAAGTDSPGIRFADLSNAREYSNILEEVRQASSLVDHLIVSFHWMPNWVRRIPGAYRRLAKDLAEAGARIVWGHSPHHILGTEWIDESIILYSTGDLLDDYALDSHFRNDRQLLYTVTLDKNRIYELHAHPLELKFGRTLFAGPEARKWIRQWLEKTCKEVGSSVVHKDQQFEIIPG